MELPSAKGIAAGLAALLLCAVLVTGCTDQDNPPASPYPSPPLRFNVTALPAKMQAWFAAAANEWNTASGQDLIRIESDGEQIAETAPSIDEGESLAINECTGGYCRITFAAIPPTQAWGACGFTPQFDPVIGALWDFRKTAMHELGHVMGAGHSTDHHDVMVPGATIWCVRPTAHDLAAILWG